MRTALTIAALALAGLSSLACAAPPPDSWALAFSGASHHFSAPQARDKHWTELNDGVGIEYRSRLNGYENGYQIASVGTLRDSLGKIGGYVGWGAQRVLLETETTTVYAGLSGFIFYRTLQWDGPRTFVPAILPVASVRHAPSGIGANFVAIPPFQTSQGKMPGVLFIQGTLLF